MNRETIGKLKELIGDFHRTEDMLLSAKRAKESLEAGDLITICFESVNHIFSSHAHRISKSHEGEMRGHLLLFIDNEIARLEAELEMIKIPQEDEDFGAFEVIA